ncbi:cation diffusion facilitator family transporter [Corynebacterium amycolatum]|uniref:cation diffusion facilitator family transporter n=1 Tax=Corynebacterium amycolatum TaxID=43765 RepID=UPI003EDF63C2
MDTTEHSGHSNGHGHSHGHDHDHAHFDPANTPARRLLAAAGLTLVVFLAELIGGLVSGSLALLADAGHMVTDSAGLLMAVAGLAIAQRGANHRATYGYRRVEVLTALVNGLTVFIIAAVILWGAIRRFGSVEQSEIQTTSMLIIAVIGLLTNVIAAFLLAGAAKESVNVRGAYLHVLVDAAGSVAVIISAIAIAYTGWTAIDSVVSIVIALFIVPRAAILVRDCLHVLLEYTPEGVDTEKIAADLSDLDGVVDVHDLHVWSLNGNDLLASVHLVRCDTLPNGDEHALLDRAQALLHDVHGIEHATVQIERTGHADHEYPAHT